MANSLCKVLRTVYRTSKGNPFGLWRKHTFDYSEKKKRITEGEPKIALLLVVTSMLGSANGNLFLLSNPSCKLDKHVAHDVHEHECDCCPDHQATSKASFLQTKRPAARVGPQRAPGAPPGDPQCLPPRSAPWASSPSTRAPCRRAG